MKYISYDVIIFKFGIRYSQAHTQLYSAANRWIRLYASHRELLSCICITAYGTVQDVSVEAGSRYGILLAYLATVFA